MKIHVSYIVQNKCYREPMGSDIYYRGRFAPSPTGPLHFGSLVAALGSYLDAKAHGGEWLVRIEDIDTPRTVPGAADDILRTLERFGLEWDGPVLYQSSRLEAYEAALERLGAFPCGCSRKDVGDRYPGTCRNGIRGRVDMPSWRFRVPDEIVSFEDRRLGPQHQKRTTATPVTSRPEARRWAFRLPARRRSRRRPTRASPTWCAERISSIPPRARSSFSGPSACHSPAICTCQWSSTKPARNSASRLVPPLSIPIELRNS